MKFNVIVTPASGHDVLNLSLSLEQIYDILTEHENTYIFRTSTNQQAHIINDTVVWTDLFFKELT